MKESEKSKGILRILIKPRKIQNNVKESDRIRKDPKESEKILKNLKECERISRNLP
mgnify:CR=1 FL=1